MLRRAAVPLNLSALEGSSEEVLEGGVVLEDFADRMSVGVELLLEEFYVPRIDSRLKLEGLHGATEVARGVAEQVLELIDLTAIGDGDAFVGGGLAACLAVGGVPIDQAVALLADDAVALEDEFTVAPVAHLAPVAVAGLLLLHHYTNNSQTTPAHI